MGATTNNLVDPATQQDALRSFRVFVNTLAGVANDQSWDHLDGTAYQQPYQYQVVNSTTGQATIEGAAITTTNAGGLVLSPGIVMLAAGVALALVLLK